MNRTEIYNVDVAVIGGGPSGLSAAIELKRKGVGKVVVIDREPEAGGIPRHCGHPPFGFWEYGRVMSGPDYAKRNVAEALKAGVEIRVKHTVVNLGAGGLLDIVSPDGPMQIQAKRVLLATGARETPRSARLVGGDRPVGVINTGALQSYLYLQGLKPFDRPLIVGTELVSLSAVLSCLKAGIKPVAMIEANYRATARWPFSLFPRVCGVPMHYGAQLLEVNGVGRVESAKVRLQDGSTREFECDGVLLTGRFTPEASLVRLSAIQLDEKSGGPVIDQFGRCSDPSYFAAGNLLRPIETAGWSFREGRRIARLIEKDLRGDLPSCGKLIEVSCNGALKLCVPQRLAPVDAVGLKQLQLRVNKSIEGRLTVKADGKEIWAKTLKCVPERRLLIPISKLPLSAGVQHIEVDFVNNN